MTTQQPLPPAEPLAPSTADASTVVALALVCLDFQLLALVQGPNLKVRACRSDELPAVSATELVAALLIRALVGARARKGWPVVGSFVRRILIL